MKYNWKIPKQIDFEYPMRQYRLFLRERGLRDSTILGYEGNLLRYLKFCGTDKP